jgi:hypothetical protein
MVQSDGFTITDYYSYRGRTYGHDNIVVRVSAKSCAYDLERRRKFRLCDWSNLTLAKRDWPNWLRLRYHALTIVHGNFCHEIEGYT